MTEDVIREIERKHVSYLLWSNRIFSEYGVPVFGRISTAIFGDYLKSHYRPVSPVIPNTGSDLQWTAVVWERKTRNRSANRPR